MTNFKNKHFFYITKKTELVPEKNDGRFKSRLSIAQWLAIKTFLSGPDKTVSDVMSHFKNPHLTIEMLYVKNHKEWRFDLRARQRNTRLHANRAFSDAQERQIVKSYQSGKSSVQVAKVFGCHSTTILQVLKHAGLSARRDYNKGTMAGAKHHQWRGGKTKTAEFVRFTPEYKAWRTSVFQRDGYRCVLCGLKPRRVEADHIKPQCLFPELILVVSNGRTLCKPCHRATPTYGYNVKYYSRDDFPDTP